MDTHTENPKGRRRAGLTRDVVVAGALRVLDRDGIAGLSMRSVGHELGVQAMSLYNHIADKDDLLDAIAEAIVADTPPTDPDLTAEDVLFAVARGLRTAVLKHPHAAPLVASRPLASEAALIPVEATLTALRQLGLPPDEALSAFWLLTSYVTGAVLAEAAATTELRSVAIGPTNIPDDERFLTTNELAPLIAASDYQVEFERGLAHIIGSLAAH